MSAENAHQPNSGVLFPNSESWIAAGNASGKNRPKMGGEVNIQCPCCQQESRFRVAAWNKTGSESGRPFLSLAFNVASDDDRKGGAK